MYLSHYQRYPLVNGAVAQTPATQPSSPTTVLFQNARIADGTHGQLSGPSNFLVRGNLIEKVSSSPIPTDRSGMTKIIDGGGETLMPGCSMLTAMCSWWLRR
ncbi:MAG TPA: hypothetical protein VK638_02750 [Edaphobacter sp.]|nr:hypothetical protein [Edaphobacter sp.]